MYKYLFGPVPSRRLGMSLGVDLVPKKVCTLDCVYCEVGKTTELTLERKEYISFDAIKRELIDYFNNNPDPDYITFSGSGEPTLNSRLGEVADLIKGLRPTIPIALLTNGTLLPDAKVREAIKNIDVILPSLDAVSQNVFQKIDRACKGLSASEHIGGLIDLRNEFSGKIWLEVFILPGYNDSREELDHFKEALLQIRPDSIQLNTLDRPGTVPGIRGATRQELQEIANYWQLDTIEIISAAPDRKDIQSYRNELESVIWETISRRPCTLDDLHKMLGIHISEINKYLDVLESEDRIEAVEMERGIFYQAKEK